MLSPRTKQIINVMLQNDGIISVQHLAKEVGVSKRTVQRELESMGKSLKPYGLLFQSKTGSGVWIDGSIEQKNLLLEEIGEEDIYDISDREKRRKRLILEILKEKGLKKLFVYSSKFQVSEATISGDLEAVEHWLNQHGLYIIRKPGSGIYVEGSEQNYRKAIGTFIHENINTELIWEAYNAPFEMTTSYDNMKKSGIGQMLDEEILARVMKCITELNTPRIMTLTEHSYLGLILHIAIAINRMIHQEMVEVDEQWAAGMEVDADYQLAEDIVWSLEEEFEVEIPQMEICYICLHIKGAKHEKIAWENNEWTQLEKEELKQILNEMIYSFDETKAYLLKQDVEFIQGLMAHLQPTMVRLQHDLQIQNPILEGIKRDYNDVFERCKKVARVIEQKINKTVPEQEIGFLAIHFGAALVRLEKRTQYLRPVRVAVVCSSGIGISRLMSSKLEKIFQDRMVIHTYGKRDITSSEEKKYDFCISSIKLGSLSIPVVEVNPLLNEDDIFRIRELVNRYEMMPEPQVQEVTLSDQMEEVHVMATQINQIIKTTSLISVESEISFEELVGKIGRNLSPYTDRQEMIQKAIMDREKISTQIFAEFDFALLHARTEGVVEPVFQVYQTRKCEPYKDLYFKHITMVFVMLVPMDNNLKANTEIMGHISTMLAEDMMFIDVVRKGKEEEIQKLLSIELKKYFGKYLSRFTT